MLWHGRLYGCGSWRPVDKKLICGMEGENIVTYGCLPFPGPLAFDPSRFCTLNTKH